MEEPGGVDGYKDLVKNAERNLYEISFVATNEVMYLNLDLSDLRDNGIYYLYLAEAER